MYFKVKLIFACCCVAEQLARTWLNVDFLKLKPTLDGNNFIKYTRNPGQKVNATLIKKSVKLIMNCVSLAKKLYNVVMVQNTSNASW